MAVALSVLLALSLRYRQKTRTNAHFLVDSDTHGSGPTRGSGGDRNSVITRITPSDQVFGAAPYFSMYAAKAEEVSRLDNNSHIPFGGYTLSRTPRQRSDSRRLADTKTNHVSRRVFQRCIAPPDEFFSMLYFSSTREDQIPLSLRYCCLVPTLFLPTNIFRCRGELAGNYPVPIEVGA